jgi:itaconate CoA-transferase
MYAYSSILAALLQRGKTGKGSHIDVSMLESLAEWMGFPMYYAYDGAPPPPRSGASHATIYPYGPFPAGDGGTVMLGCRTSASGGFLREGAAAAGAGHRPALRQQRRRNEHREALRAIIVETFGALSTAQVLERLDAAQIANARMNDMAGLWAHPQLQARDRWREVGSPAGDIPALLPAGRQSAFDYRMDAIPAVGRAHRGDPAQPGPRRSRHRGVARGEGGLNSPLALARTFLFVPADRPERHARALAMRARVA